MADIPPTRDDAHARDTRASARAASASFWASVDHLPRTHRRVRRLAQGWEHAAAMAYWHRREVYRPAEELGFGLIAGLTRQSCARRQWLEFADACEHATVMLERQRHPSRELRSTRSPKTLHKRGPFADHTELRWRMSGDVATLRFPTFIAGNPATSREAQRRYLPWLTQTLEALDQPMTITELDVIAAQWRARRAEFLDNPTWADVIMVDPVPRKPATRWWRLRHGDEPPLPH